VPLQIKGRKRHILVDTLGLLLNVVVHPADIQDRDGALHLLRSARRLFPFIERIFLLTADTRDARWR
jgi:transposase